MKVGISKTPNATRPRKQILRWNWLLLTPPLQRVHKKAMRNSNSWRNHRVFSLLRDPREVSSRIRLWKPRFNRISVINTIRLQLTSLQLRFMDIRKAHCCLLLIQARRSAYRLGSTYHIKWTTIQMQTLSWRTISHKSVLIFAAAPTGTHSPYSRVCKSKAAYKYIHPHYFKRLWTSNHNGCDPSTATRKNVMRLCDNRRDRMTMLLSRRRSWSRARRWRRCRCSACWISIRLWANLCRFKGVRKRLMMTWISWLLPNNRYLRFWILLMLAPHSTMQLSSPTSSETPLTTIWKSSTTKLK